MTARKTSGKEAGQNNSNLALHEIQVECGEMGTISNDGSHLCFMQELPATGFTIMGVLFQRYHSVRYSLYNRNGQPLP
jgi:hypothetical protein